MRFIAIKEHYDNFDTDGSNESLMIPLQNMINALYSKDISRKVSTALKAQMEQGTFQKRNLPYGYRWNEDHTNMVIDEETAPYVRLMFQWKIEGWSIPMILNELDRLGAPNTELRKQPERNPQRRRLLLQRLVQFNAVRHPEQSALCG